jgi:nitrite reductase/ring-hydroxylating ferredoxin subunit
MDVATELPALQAAYRPGFSLPRPFYTDAQVFELDLERVFYRRWLFAGHACQVPRPCDYFTFDVGSDSLIVIRGDDGQVRALFNTCRHRGSRVCLEPAGRAAKLVCPYHQWVYERDGSLSGARWMGDDFNRSRYPLHWAHVQVLAGLIFVCLAEEPPDFEPARRAIERHARPHRLDRARACHVEDYAVRANWKVLFKNNRECYHCTHGHPEFCRTNYDLGMPGQQRSSSPYGQRLREQAEEVISRGRAGGRAGRLFSRSRDHAVLPHPGQGVSPGSSGAADRPAGSAGRGATGSCRRAARSSDRLGVLGGDHPGRRDRRQALRPGAGIPLERQPAVVLVADTLPRAAGGRRHPPGPRRRRAPPAQRAAQLRLAAQRRRADLAHHPGNGRPA